MREESNKIEKMVLKIADKHLCVIKRVRTIDERCVTFDLKYACENFWKDLRDIRKPEKYGWFVKNGKLLVYR